jgi:WD40 repeat protein
MKSCVETIELIEKLRKAVAEHYGKLLTQSGAVTLQKPDLLSCLMGLLFQAARDIGPDIDKIIKVKIESPYVELDMEKAKAGAAGDVQSTIDCFVELAKSLVIFKDEGENLKNKGEELFNKVTNEGTKWFDDFKAKCDDFMKIKDFLNHCADNSKKIGNALNCAKEIVTLVASVAIHTATLFKKMTNQQELGVLYTLCKKIRDDVKTKKELSSNRVLYWEYTTEIKWGAFDDMKPIWKKITGEDYSEKGPVKVEKKEETKKDDKAGAKKEEGKKEEGKKEEGKKEEKKVEEKKGEEKKVAEVSQHDGKKMAEMQNQIDELKKMIEDLKAKGGSSIFIHKPVPLKNWNISLRNSIEVGVNNYVKCICINYEADLVVFGTKNGSLLTHKLSTFEQVRSSKIHNGTIKDITYLYDGKHVISAGNDGKIIKTDVTNGQSKESNHVLPGAIKSIAYGLDGSNLYVACGRNLYCYDINNMIGQYEHKFMDFEDELLKVAYVRESKLLALGFRNGMVRLIDPSNKSKVAEFKDHNRKRVTDITAVRHNGAPAIATTSKDMAIHIYDCDERALKSSFKVATSKTNTHANKMIYGHDEKTLFTLHDDGKIVLNQYQTGGMDREQTNKHFGSNLAKLSAGFYAGDGTTFIVGMQAEQEGRAGKVEIYVTK